MSFGRVGLSWLVVVVVASACGGNARTERATAGSGGGEGAAISDVCETSADCVLIGSGCCDCGDGPLSTLTPINQASRAAFEGTQCAPGILCGQCNPRGINAPESFYTAICKAGHCVAADLRGTTIADCTTDADCHARHDVGCCDDCDSDATIAVGPMAERMLQTLVCAEPVECRQCDREVPMGATGVRATCEEGKCQLTGFCNYCY